jgi:LPS O-antigen subunit length determinant protein (WzzB/FepE family)
MLSKDFAHKSHHLEPKGTTDEITLIELIWHFWVCRIWILFGAAIGTSAALGYCLLTRSVSYKSVITAGLDTSHLVDSKSMKNAVTDMQEILGNSKYVLEIFKFISANMPNNLKPIDPYHLAEVQMDYLSNRSSISKTGEMQPIQVSESKHSSHHVSIIVVLPTVGFQDKVGPVALEAFNQAIKLSNEERNLADRIALKQDYIESQRIVSELTEVSQDRAELPTEVSQILLNLSDMEYDFHVKSIDYPKIGYYLKSVHAKASTDVLDDRLPFLATLMNDLNVRVAGLTQIAVVLRREGVISEQELKNSSERISKLTEQVANMKHRIENAENFKSLALGSFKLRYRGSSKGDLPSLIPIAELTPFRASASNSTLYEYPVSDKNPAAFALIGLTLGILFGWILAVAKFFFWPNLLSALKKKSTGIDSSLKTRLADDSIQTAAVEAS